MPRRVRTLVILLLAATWGCSSDGGSIDAALGLSDASPAVADAAPVSTDAAPVNADAEPAADADQAAADATTPDAAPDAAPAFPDASTPDAEPADAGPAVPMAITSPSIIAAGVFPDLHTCEGRDIQPRLDFANVPAGAQSLAVVLIDDTIDFVHWIALDIPAATVRLPEGASDTAMLPRPTREIQAYGLQYQGPCPPARRPHTYTFRLYALSVAQTNYRWPRGGAIDDANLTDAFGANTLDQARLTGTFTR